MFQLKQNSRPGGAIFDLFLYRCADILSIILYFRIFGPPQFSMGPLGPYKTSGGAQALSAPPPPPVFYGPVGPVQNVWGGARAPSAPPLCSPLLPWFAKWDAQLSKSRGDINMECPPPQKMGEIGSPCPPINLCSWSSIQLQKVVGLHNSNRIQIQWANGNSSIYHSNHYHWYNICSYAVVHVKYDAELFRTDEN